MPTSSLIPQSDTHKINGAKTKSNFEPNSGRSKLNRIFGKLNEGVSSTIRDDHESTRSINRNQNYSSISI